MGWLLRRMLSPSVSSSALKQNAVSKNILLPEAEFKYHSDSTAGIRTFKTLAVQIPVYAFTWLFRQAPEEIISIRR